MRVYPVPEGILCISRDITERKRTEEELRLHSEIMKNMSEGINLVRVSDNVIVYTNSKFEEMCGYDPGEMVGKHISVVNALAEKSPEETAREIMESLKKHGDWQGDIHNIKKDGTPFWCHASVSWFDHSEYGRALISAHTDITKRKRAEEALRESEKRLRTAQRVGAVGDWEFDVETQQIDWSEQVYRLFERDPAQGPPTYKENMTYYYPEDSKKLQEQVRRAIKLGENSDSDHHLKLPSGKSVYQRGLIRVKKDENGKIIKLYGTVQDITARKQAEEALKASEQNLQDLIYIASHDLQTPIVSMVGYASNLLNKYAQGMDEKGVYAVQRLKANAERLHQLVLSLLDLSRLNTVKNPYRTFDPEKVVGYILKNLELAVQESGAEIVTETMLPMHGDEPRLTSVFRNLLSNALKYGGKHILVGYQEDAYFVRDDGIGIAPRNLEKIFRPGERLKKVDVEGVGMGLTFCQKVITQHNGKIWADSEGEGKGSTLYFTIGL